MKKVAISILFIVWLLVIFLFSNQNGVSSKQLSRQVLDKIISISSYVTNQSISPEKKEQIIKKYHPIIRKIAHFTIYFILGILVYLAVYLYKKNKKWTIWISVVFCIIYACSDEFHQILSVGRTFKVKDILIDTLGSLFGILLIKK
ncbi:MAG: VanZ family protein [Bacilli bacterium]|nr:VanZ family protein [Bacilli bacterium]